MARNSFYEGDIGVEADINTSTAVAESWAIASKDSAVSSASSALDASESKTAAAGSASIVLNAADAVSGDIDAAALSASSASGSATAAAISAGSALSYKNELTALSTSTEDLAEGASATTSYSSETGVLSIGLPTGSKGSNGLDSFETWKAQDASNAGKSFADYMAVIEGATGNGVTGGSYAPSTGIVTITTDDSGISVSTDDLRGQTPALTVGATTTTASDTNASVVGTPDGIDLSLAFNISRGADSTIAGPGYTSGGYDSATGIVSFVSDDGLGFVTGDLRGTNAPTFTLIDNGDSTYTLRIDAP